MRKQPNAKRKHDEVKHDNIEEQVNSKAINISKLKDFVTKNFPPESPLRIVFVGEDDVLSADAFLAKPPI
jgi:hypothetical protein